jgi:AraC-like DNA-binding protein
MRATAKAQTSKLAVYEYQCTAGPRDRPFTEMHRDYSISYVRRGSFGCVSQGRLHELVPGSVLIGRPGLEYMCTHEHHACGDDCLSFKFTPQAVEDLGAHDEIWRLGAVPPLANIMITGELAQAVADGRSTLAFDEVAYMFAARFIRSVRPAKAREAKLRQRDRQRVIDIARWIEASSHEDIDLETTARAAGMSSFHLLRTFARVLGLTPHQYLIRARLRHAARLLTDEGSTVTQIAGAVGFADLSNFIRTFGRAAGMSPQEFRRAARG